MEWRPQKEGIATDIDKTRPGLKNSDGMETSKRRDCDIFLTTGSPERAFRWNGDLKKKGLRHTIIFFIEINFDKMEWRPQKEGIATSPWNDPITRFGMEWRPQKEGIATVTGFQL